jgi:hypothetical protein
MRDPLDDRQESGAMRWLARSRPVGPTIVGTFLTAMGANLLAFTLDNSGAMSGGLLALWVVAAILNIGAGLAVLAEQPWAWRASLAVAIFDILVSVSTTVVYGPGGWFGEIFALVSPAVMIGYLLTADARRDFAPGRR